MFVYFHVIGQAGYVREAVAVLRWTAHQGELQETWLIPKSFLLNTKESLQSADQQAGSLGGAGRLGEHDPGTVLDGNICRRPGETQGKLVLAEVRTRPRT